jgi:hypothetical protein
VFKHIIRKLPAHTGILSFNVNTTDNVSASEKSDEFLQITTIFIYFLPYVTIIHIHFIKIKFQNNLSVSITVKFLAHRKEYSTSVISSNSRIKGLPDIVIFWILEHCT